MKQRFVPDARGLGFAAILLVAVSGPAPAQDSKTMVMKLGTATLNDAQHEWMKRFAAARSIRIPAAASKPRSIRQASSAPFRA